MRKTNGNNSAQPEQVDNHSPAEMLLKTIKTAMRKDPNREEDEVQHLEDLDFLACEILKMRRKFHGTLAETIPPNITREFITGRNALLECDIIIKVTNPYFDTRTAIGIQDCTAELDVAAIVAHSCCLIAGDESQDGDGLISAIYNHLIKSEITYPHLTFIADEAAIEDASVAHEICVEPKMEGSTKRIWISFQTFAGLEVEGWSEDVLSSITALQGRGQSTCH